MPPKPHVPSAAVVVDRRSDTTLGAVRAMSWPCSLPIGVVLEPTTVAPWDASSTSDAGARVTVMPCGALDVTWPEIFTVPGVAGAVAAAPAALASLPPLLLPPLELPPPPDEAPPPPPPPPPLASAPLASPAAVVAVALAAVAVAFRGFADR